MQSSIDKAIIAYRENPTEANRQALLALQAARVNAFYSSQASEFITRTSR